MRNKILGMYDFEMKVYSLYTNARIFNVSSDTIRERLDQCIYTELNSVTPKGKARYSRYMKGYVTGLVAMCNKEMYNHVEFCYEINNVLFSTHKDSKRRTTEEFYTNGRGHELLDKQGYFYYKNSDTKYF